MAKKILTAYNLQEEIDKADGKLILPPGQIVVTQPITLPSDFILEGNNTEITISFEDNYVFNINGIETNRALLRQDISAGSATRTMLVNNAGGFNVGDSITIIKSNGSFPQKAEFNTIDAIKGNELTLRNNFVLDYKQSEVVDIIAYQGHNNITLRNLDIRGTVGFKTFGIFARFTERLIIENVRFANIAVNPIHIEQSYFPEINNCNFFNNGRPSIGDHGVRIAWCMNAQVNSNALVESGGLYIKGSTAATFSNNSFDGSGPTGGSGITIISTFKSIFQGNTILRGACYGIWVLNGSRDNIIKANNISSCVSSGIYLGEKRSTTLEKETGKEVEDKSSLSDDDNVLQNLPINSNIVSNNTCSSSVRGNGIFIDTMASFNSIVNSQTLDNRSCGIRIHGNNNIVTGNTALRNGRQNISVAGRDNEVHDNVDMLVPQKSRYRSVWFRCDSSSSSSSEDTTLACPDTNVSNYIKNGC